MNEHKRNDTKRLNRKQNTIHTPTRTKNEATNAKTQTMHEVTKVKHNNTTKDNTSEKTKTKTGTCVISNRHRGGLFVFETSNMLRGSDPVLITFFLLICVSSYYCVEHHNQACKFLQRSDLFGLPEIRKIGGVGQAGDSRACR